MASRPIILWFRHDLRLADHPALAAATASGEKVLPVFILDDAAPGAWANGGASRWWLHHSLTAQAAALAAIGGKLVLRRGRTVELLAELAAAIGAGAVYCSRGYEPWAARLEEQVRVVLQQSGVELRRFAGTLLREPEELRTKSGEPFKVYTPFWRALSSDWQPAAPVAAPDRLVAPKQPIRSDALESWELCPSRPNWAAAFSGTWSPGEAGAQARLDAFLASALGGYSQNRDRPDLDATSRLSPHLHFGEISPRRCWHLACSAAAGIRGSERALDTFLRELCWREFSYHLLVHFPHLPEAPFRPEFANFPWVDDAVQTHAWQRGRTGYPIVDAGMRELWTTGWMHNRVRMIVASFLVKDLRIPWQTGEAWFWDTLVDADLANNAASWQWVAGSGADAAPYFRIFNPVSQGQKFDPHGHYVRRWVAEIARLPDSVIHAPWTASPAELAAAGVRLGETYPMPIVDHGRARAEALAAFEQLKKGRAA